MRYAAVAALALCVVVAAALYLGQPGPPATVVATPTPTSGPSGSSSAPTSAASPSQTASAPVLSGAVTVRVTRTAVPAEFRYVALGSGQDFQVVILDLDAARTIVLAEAHLTSVQTAVGQTGADVSASSDGRTVLVLLSVPGATSSLFVLRPETGEARLLVEGRLVRAVLSPDGRRFAVGRNDADRALTGLWVGETADGISRRLIADEPDAAGTPPLPYDFSPAGDALVFGLGVGEAGYYGMYVATSSPEGRVDRTVSAPRIVGGEVTPIRPASGAEFRSEREAVLWNSRGAFGGGDTMTYTFDVTTKTATDLYRPSTPDSMVRLLGWRPRAEQYAIAERPYCCGINLPESVWLRGRDGSARRLGEWPFIIEAWWSRDGSRLFAWFGGDDSVAGITDLLTGKGVMQFCLRGGGTPPPRCA